MATVLKKSSFVLALALTSCIAYGCGSDSNGGQLFGADGGPDASQSNAGGSGFGNGGASGSANTSGGTAGVGIGGSSSGGAGVGGAGGSGLQSCAKDADCTGAAKRCDTKSGVCAECLFDNECNLDERCTSGACHGLTTCTSSKDCRANTDGRTICDTLAGVCIQCIGDADCAPGKSCAIDTCVASTTCQPGDAGSGASCGTGKVCSPTGTCVGCVTDTDCSGGTKCFTGTCRTPCTSDNACATGNQLCNKTMGACVDCMQDTECDALEHCAAGTCEADVCAQGVKGCVGDAIVECTANGDGINPPVACTGGKTCVKKGVTAACEAPSKPDGGTPPPGECTDGKKNGTETDVDCGGSCPTKCADGKVCAKPTDCATNVCEASCSGLLCFPGTRGMECRPAACTDQVKNGAETDVDCGGDSCKRCPVDDACTANGDCETNICTAGKCVAAQCSADKCGNTCFITEQRCCKNNGLCGCVGGFPLPHPCQ